MEKSNIDTLEKYAAWIRVNSALRGPCFIGSVVYITSYIVISVLLIVRPEIIKPYLIYYYIGFVFFIIAVWLMLKLLKQG